MSEALLSVGFDPFTLEIVKSKLIAITEEMSIVLARTSMSPIVYEVLDFACGITDSDGQVVAQANGLTLFTGTFSTQVRSVTKKFGADGIRRGDIFVTNGPYDGGTHTCDIALIMPVWCESVIVAFAVSITHWTEVGGMTPGSISPDATEIYQEGLQFPVIHIMHQGRLVEEVVDIIRANVRLPLMSLGDLNAGIAACRIAELRVAETCARYGVEIVLRAFDDIVDYGERMARQAIRRIPNGIYEAEDFIDGDGITNEQIPIRVKVTVEDEAVTADFTGCALQRPGPINCSYGALNSACKTVFKAITDPQAPSNEGWFRPYRIVIPDGTVFSAVRPASTGWYYEASAHATELVWKALAPLLPEYLTAGSYLSLCVTYIGGYYDETGEVWVHPEPHNGGWGAGRGLDGQNGLIATTDGDTNNYPIEFLEEKFPILVESYELNQRGGGGAGEWRGGLGLIRKYRMLGSNTFLHASMGRNIVKPWGLAGGSPGSNNYVEVVRNGQLMTCARVSNYQLQKGDIVHIHTGAGGGYGHPSQRLPSRVAEDVQGEYITRDEAQRIYGVALHDDFSVDQAATRALRG